MDVLNTYGLFGGIVLGILSAGATFFNKQRFTAQIALLQAGNDELRNQNKDLRDERTDHLSQLAACKARDEEKEKVISAFKSQPNFAQLIKLINTNHKEIMVALHENKNGK